MVVRVFEAVSQALPGHDVVVAVDDDRVLDALGEHGVGAGLLTRIDCASGTDRAAEIARLLEWGPDDIIINVQGDEPLVPAELLAEFARFCSAFSDLSMATVSVPVRDPEEISDPNVVKLMVRNNGEAISFSRAMIPFDRDRDADQWEPSNYLRHVGIYAYSNEVLQVLTATPPCSVEQVENLEQLRALWLGIPIQVLAWPESPPGGVDTAEDVARVIAVLTEEER
jgi:3-deoxy-manno-octulosonate cytidylyltransferase (CMP-KDO synthetase)